MSHRIMSDSFHVMLSRGVLPGWNDYLDANLVMGVVTSHG